MLGVIVASIAAIKGGTQCRLLGSNALSIFLYSAAIVVGATRNIFDDQAHVLIDGGLVFVFFAMFLFGISIERKSRGKQSPSTQTRL